MSATKATRGSGSWCRWISLTPSLTVAGTSEVTSTEELGIDDGKMAGASVHIFPAVDATYGNKSRSLFTLLLEFLGLFLVYLVRKRGKKRVFYNYPIITQQKDEG